MAFVQKATHVTVDAASGTVAITLTGVAAGNALVKTAAIYNNTLAWTIASVSDGSAFTVHTGVHTAADHRQYSMVAYRVNVGAGSHTVTTTLGGTFNPGLTYAELDLEEHSGIDTTSPAVTADANDDQSITSNDVNAGPVSSAAATDIFFGCAELPADSATSLAWGSPASWTNIGRKNDGFSSGTGYDAGYWYPGSIQTTYTPQWSHRNISGSEGSAVVVVLKAAAAAAASLLPRRPSALPVLMRY